MPTGFLHATQGARVFYSHHNWSGFAQGLAMYATPFTPACFTRRRLQVRVLYRPPIYVAFSGFTASYRIRRA